MSTASFAEITLLSTAERIQLVEDIWDTIAANSEELVLTPSQTQELDRRLEAHQQNPQAGASWPEVQLRIRQQK